MNDPIMLALVHLGIEPDHTRVEEGWYITSMMDLRDTETADAYITVLWTDKDLIEHLAIVHIEGNTAITELYTRKG